MRIAYICADRGIQPDGHGGSSRHVSEMVNSLVARGNEVTVFAASVAGAGTELAGDIVDLRGHAPLAGLQSSLQKAARLAEDESWAAREIQAIFDNEALGAALADLHPLPDMVYERQSLWAVAGLRYAKAHRIPHLLEVNAPLVAQQLEYRQLELASAAAGIENWMIAGTDRLLVTSPSLVDYVRAHGATRRNVRLVRCGVPAALLERTVGGGGKAATRDPSRFVIGFVGSLKPWHGIEVLLEAFRKLHAADFCYRLLIVGDGPERLAIERYLRVHGLDAFCEMTGDVPASEIPRQLARMDVGVAPYPELTSFYFSPLKIWEYAGAGVPIAASAIGDLPQLFPHKEGALLHRPGSANKLALHITKLRENPDLGARLARRAKRTARAHTWDRIAGRVESIAAAAIRARPPIVR